MVQVLSKAFKIAPIMLMGKLLGNKSYPLYDYVVAGTIALGEHIKLLHILCNSTTPS